MVIVNNLSNIAEMERVFVDALETADGVLVLAAQEQLPAFLIKPFQRQPIRIVGILHGAGIIRMFTIDQA